MKRLVALIALLSFLSTSQAAENTTATTAGGLLGALKEAERIATRERLNIDEMAEFTTILKGERLRAAGIKDLFEALSLVPGIQTSVMQNGIKKVVMRGYDNPNSFVFDKFKLIVDDHTITTTVFQNSSYYLNFPIELIERIEVVLGPAAALQTSGALTGVIKLYTKTGLHKGTGALFSRGGSWNEAMAGLRKTFRFAEKGTVAFDGYFRRHDRALTAEAYAYGDTLENIRPPESSEWNKDASVGMALRYGNLSVTGRCKREHHGNYFGWEEHLERSTATGMISRYSYLQTDYRTNPTKDETLHFQLAFNHFRYEASLEKYLFGLSVSSPPSLPVRMVQSEQNWQTDLSVTTHRFPGHTFQLGWHGMASRQNDNRFEVSGPLGHDGPLTQSGLKRYLSSFYLIDAIEIGENLDARFALRYDRLSDLHEGYMSVDATVRYRLDEDIQCKIGYGHAYRAPSWIELHTVGYPGLRMGNPDLKAEEADTIETSILFTSSYVHKIQLSLYHTRVHHFIDNLEVPQPLQSKVPEYDNFPNRQSTGFEFSYRYRPSVSHDLQSAFAFNDTDYVTERGIEQSMPGIAKWTGYLLYLYHPDATTTFSTTLHYIGEKTANEESGRKVIDASLPIDITASHTAADGWKIFATVKNLFDTKILQSSYYDRHEGLIRPGRSFFITLEFPL